MCGTSVSLASASADGRGRDVRHHRSRAAAGRPGGPAVPRAGLPVGGAGAGAAESDHPGGVVRHPRLLARRSDRAARRYVGGGAPRRVGLGPAGPAAPSPGGPVAAAVTGAACHRQVVAGVLAADPALSASQIETALQVVVTSPAVLRALAAALAADPAALSTGAPPVVGRLVTELVARGAGSLPEPSCVHCRRTDRPLTRSVAGGVCARCRRRELAEPCARCGVTKPVAGAVESAPAALIVRSGPAAGAAAFAGSPDAPTVTSPTSVTAASGCRRPSARAAVGAGETA